MAARLLLILQLFPIMERFVVFVMTQDSFLIG